MARNFRAFCFGVTRSFIGFPAILRRILRRLPLGRGFGGFRRQLCNSAGQIVSELTHLAVEYVAQNPDALPLDTLRDDLKLLVIGREFQTAAGLIDVFAVDDKGQLYVIETKLYKNPDKRHVIAQMLDYGASLWRGYMNTDQFMTDVDTACRSSGGKGLDVALQAAFELEAGQGDLIRKAMQRNLADGVVQFIVLMDRLSERLRDLILFVNRNSKFSIFAVEMDFYRHEGLEIVIPRLHGAEVQKDTRVAVARDEMYNWSEQRFVDTVRRNFARENDTADAVAAMFAFLRGLANDVEFKNMTFEAEDCYAHFSFGQAGGNPMREPRCWQRPRVSSRSGSCATSARAEASGQAACSPTTSGRRSSPGGPVSGSSMSRRSDFGLQHSARGGRR